MYQYQKVETILYMILHFQLIHLSSSFSPNTHCNTFSYAIVTGTKYMQVASGGILPIPLSYVMSYLWVRPIDQSQPAGHGYVFCNKPITWNHISHPGETAEELRMCISSRDQCFRLVLKFSCNSFSILRLFPTECCSVMTTIPASYLGVFKF